MRASILYTTLILCTAICLVSADYAPNWESLDSRPLPAWFDEVKFGIFLHWGVYAVPSYSCDTAAEWYEFGLKSGSKCTNDFHNKNFGPDFSYSDFGPRFTAEFFDPNQWADLFQKSGAKYVVLTSKHHDGYCLWPSAEAWNWNSVEVGPHKDLVGLLTDAVRSKGIHMGLYHSLFEWYNPYYLSDKASKGEQQQYVDKVLMPQLKDVITRYKPDLLWTDGEWELPSPYWKSTEFLAWLYNTSPVKDQIIVNDRWGSDTRNKHGGFYTEENHDDPKELAKHKWERCYTIDGPTWGYARNHDISSYSTSESLIHTLIKNTAYGGNLLINVGPTVEGTIPRIFQDRLLDIGKWLELNGDAIYGTHAWRVQNQTQAAGKYPGFYTSKGDVVNYIMTGWPTDNVVVLPDPKPAGEAKVELLGFGNVKWTSEDVVKVMLPQLTIGQLPCKHAWTLRLTNFK